MVSFAVRKLPTKVKFVDGYVKKLVLYAAAFVAMTSIAAATTIPSENGVLSWKGQNWSVTSGDGFGSAYNNWSKSGDNIWIDEKDKLHLTIKEDGGLWHCTQLATQQRYKYGKFTWKVESPVFTMDKNSVLGLFTYIDDYHEIDIEISRWKQDQNNLMLFVNQPYYMLGNMFACLPSITTNGITTTEAGYDGSNMTLQIDWQPTYIDWNVWDNSGQLIASRHYTNADSIPSVEQNLYMNLWLKERPSSDGKDIEIVISDVKIEGYTEQEAGNETREVTEGETGNQTGNETEVIEEAPVKQHKPKADKVKHSVKKCGQKIKKNFQKKVPKKSNELVG